MREQPASVINTRQTCCHISMLDPGLRKEWSSVHGAVGPCTWGMSPGQCSKAEAVGAETLEPSGPVEKTGRTER